VTFVIKRIYEPASKGDGIRVLVDRLWPRGIEKADAHVDLWKKEVAPSAGLRIWFSHKPERFAEFRTRYKAELRGNLALRELIKLGRGKRVTLLYAARDPAVNHAVVLWSVLTDAASKKRASS
jgi:uncharacterized protein YeaO (DUF488 family)